MKVRAAVCTGPGELVIDTLDLRAPGPREVLVRIAATGVCASDLHVIDGRLGKPTPIVPGHEAAGTVAALGSGVDTLAVGDPVVLTIMPWCGSCEPCRQGRRRWCDWAGRLAATGTVDGHATALTRDGQPVHHFTGVSSWAEFAVVPATGAVKVPHGLPPAEAALLGCAVATGFGAVRNAADVQPGQAVAVVGCGGVGLHVVQAAGIADASPLIALDRNPLALNVAAHHGATHLLGVGDGDGDTIDDLVHSVAADGVDHCFEVLGRPTTVEQAWRALAPGGQLTVVGLLPQESTVALDAFDLIYEKRLVGTYLGGIEPARDLPVLAAAAAAGEIAFGDMIEPIAIEDLPTAVQRLRDGQVTARQVVTF